jgi:hypothetical protein
VGRFFDRRSRADSGFLIMEVMAEEAADVSVVTRNTCTTWKRK